jgi:hypothetical protein
MSPFFSPKSSSLSFSRLGSPRNFVDLPTFSIEYDSGTSFKILSDKYGRLRCTSCMEAGIKGMSASFTPGIPENSNVGVYCEHINYAMKSHADADESIWPFEQDNSLDEYWIGVPLSPRYQIFGWVKLEQSGTWKEDFHTYDITTIYPGDATGPEGETSLLMDQSKKDQELGLFLPGEGRYSLRRRLVEFTWDYGPYTNLSGQSTQSLHCKSASHDIGDQTWIYGVGENKVKAFSLDWTMYWYGMCWPCWRKIKKAMTYTAPGGTS